MTLDIPQAAPSVGKDIGGLVPKERKAITIWMLIISGLIAFQNDSYKLLNDTYRPSCYPK